MKYNVLSYIENSLRLYPDKTAVTDEKKSLSYSQLYSVCRSAGAGIYLRTGEKKPVGVYMEKNADSLCAMLGACFAGCFYSSFSTELPSERLSKMAFVLRPALIITSDELKEKAASIFSGFDIVTFEQLLSEKNDENVLEGVRERVIDTDPLYINFTSGSTGTPKGIAVSHRSVIDFIDCFSETFGFSEADVFANQAPFDFDVSVKDIYTAFKCSATLAVVPRRLFSAPAELIDYLCEKKVTVMIWAVSALCLLSTFHALDYRTPETVKKILFSGEVMPLKALKGFFKHLPDAMYVNLYGPTEITCNCTYHILEKNRDYSNGIPIGKPFLNEDVFLLDGEDKKVTGADNIGEICVRGTALALGYYSCDEQNRAHFVQNPLNPYYPELIYRTGDLGRYGENGELFFCGRKDFQIKYMGHRIELEEIERAMGAIDGVERCCCLFDEKKSRLKGFYVGSIEKEELHNEMKEKLPAFMIPGMIRRVEEMPLTKNGKIDRRALDENGGARKN